MASRDKIRKHLFIKRDILVHFSVAKQIILQGQNL